MFGQRLFHFLLRLIGAAAVVAFAMYLAITAPDQWRTPTMLWLYIIAAALILVLSSTLIRRKGWIEPMQRMERAAARMARGEWNVRVQPHGTPGAQRLASNLNQLANQAFNQLADLQQQRGGLQALVDTLPDPILATDPAGRIILLNAPAARLLSITPAQAMQQKLVSVVSDEPIVELYESLLAAGGAELTGPTTLLNREIRLVRGGQRQTFQAVATRAPRRGGAIVLRDVTTLSAAVQMKTDFVANASHELRTPIAAIKIAFETLRDVSREDPEQTERCVLIIDGHLRRLEEMLRDLLDLSRVENADIKPRVVTVKTADLLQAVKATMGPMACAKSVDLRSAETDPAMPVDFRTDLRLLNLVVKNLVENSIKFTPAGGRVTVSVLQSPSAAGNVILSVADTGIGIAPEHRERVFERFYQVDSVRTGAGGRGTGLGLAIVKHAVHALGGTVTLQSAVGAGTTVMCDFPQPAQPAVEPEPALA